MKKVYSALILIPLLSISIAQTSFGATLETSKLCSLLLTTSRAALDRRNSAEERQAHLEFFIGTLLSYTDTPTALQASVENTELVRNYRRLKARADGIQLHEPGVLEVTDQWSDELVAIPPVVIEEIARFPSGEVWEMTHEEARAYCANPRRNGRLPTAYELAVLAHHRGAQVPLESAYFDLPYPDTPEVGAEHSRMHRRTVNDLRYIPVYTTNSAGQNVVDFYANRSGFRSLAKHHFWSDSASTVLFGDIGTIYNSDHSLPTRCAVLCVR